QCDSLLLGDQCGAHTFPYIEVLNSTAQMEHEASTSKIGEDQLFYFQQRGIAPEDAVSMIVNWFCKEVFKELPMEFAVEAQKLLGVSVEGSVGWRERGNGKGERCCSKSGTSTLRSRAGRLCAASISRYVPVRCTRSWGRTARARG